jgi:MFS family permease
VSKSAKAVAVRLWGGPYENVPTEFWWLWGSTFVARVANFMLPFSILYFTVERGVTDSIAGSLVGLYGLGAVGGSLVGGVTTDRFGAKWTLVVGYSATALATITVGITSGTFALGVVMLSAGVFGGAARPATNALTAQLVPHESRVKVFSLNYWAMNVGFSVACLSAGLLAGIGFALLFCIDGATTFACAVLVLLRVSGVASRHRSQAHQALGRVYVTRKSGWLDPLRDRIFLAVVVMSVVSAGLTQQLTITLPLAMRASGHSTAEYGAVAALNGVLVCCLQMPISSFVAKKPLTLSLALGSALLGIGLGLTVFAVGILAYVLTLVVWTLGEIIAAPGAPALAARLAPDDGQGRYQGALSAAWGMGAVVGPAAGAWLFAHGTGTLLWLSCGIAGSVIALGYLSLTPMIATRISTNGRTPHQADEHTEETPRSVVLQG